MASPCPAGYIPDETSGLCRPSSTATGIGSQGQNVTGFGTGAGVASTGTSPNPFGTGHLPTSLNPSLALFSSQGESAGGNGVATSFLSRTGARIENQGGGGEGDGGGYTPPTGQDLQGTNGEVGSNPAGVVGPVDLGASPCPHGATAEPGSGACFCGDGECRDVVSGQCRPYNPNREKVNETDDITRPGGGGRGYCRQLDPGQQAHPGGSGGGGNSGGLSQFSNIWDQIQALLHSPSRFTPEVMANLEGLAKQREAGQVQVATDAASADQVRRGIYSSPLAAALTQKAREPAATDFNKSVSDLKIAKVNADAQDKMFAVQASMQWVQMMMQQNQFDANLKLAYARLLQEWQMLQAQLSDPYRLLNGVI
jgi:hypothetical protein